MAWWWVCEITAEGNKEVVDYTRGLFIPKASIINAETAADIINTALNDPEVKNAVTKYLGTSAQGPIGSLIGTVLGALCVHFGIAQPDPTAWTLICGGGAIIGGYIWQWIANKLTPSMPPSPPPPT